jgi:hypothetical protein
MPHKFIFMESQKQQSVSEWSHTASEAGGKNVNEMAEKYAHIKDWGIDADPDNDPTYPIKQWNGNDYLRLNYKRPVQQPLTIEKLHSNERPSVSAVFGNAVPPSGMSGMLRRYAFRFSEGRWAHWLTLLLADRVNMVEGIADDIRKGYFPNIFKERGWNAEWKYNQKGVIKMVAIATGFAAVAILLLTRGRKKYSY